jgi:hypothetical protein
MGDALRLHVRRRDGGDPALPETDVAAVNLKQGAFILDDGRIGQITNMFDDEGDETRDPDEAAVVVGFVGVADWWTIRMCQFESSEMH